MVLGMLSRVFVLVEWREQVPALHFWNFLPIKRKTFVHVNNYELSKVPALQLLANFPIKAENFRPCQQL
jgi:hypothetical protein